LTDAPCIVTEATDEKSLVMALVENLQREDLNAIDEAEAFAQLKGDFHLSQEQVAERVGKSRVAVANSLRLLNLPAAIQEDVRDNLITAGHARALLSIPDKSKQRQVWLQIKNNNLTVRETEDLCREMGVKRTTQTSALTGRGKPAKAGNADPQLRQLEEELMSRLGSRVAIRATGTGRGRVELHYSDLDEFERILEALGLPAADRL
jgi:ParB family chromosome partitioning protein